MMSEKHDSDGRTRRKTLRMLAASGIGLGFASGNAVAQDGGLSRAEGTSSYVTSNEETPDWFTIKDDGEWNVHDPKAVQSGGVSTQGHNNCSNDTLNLGFDRKIKGVEFTFVIHHCAQTCRWGLDISAVGQSYDSRIVDNCDSEVSVDFNAGVATLEGTVSGHSKDNDLLGMVEWWEVDLLATWYDPSKGWESTRVVASIENPLA